MHIAFFAIPMSGHIYPTLEVVRELIRRGHRVTYPTTAERRAVVSATGASVPVYESSLVSTSDAEVSMPGREQWMTHMRLLMVEETAVVLPQLLASFGDDRPDLVVHDRAAFAGRVFAAKHGLPTVQVVPTFAANAHWAVTQKFAPVDTSAPADAEYQSKLKALLALHEVAWEELPAPRCQVVFIAKAFQYSFDTFGNGFHFVGPCLRESSSSWTPPSSDRPILLISMGTVDNAMPDFYRLCFQAFEDSPWHIVMSVGPRLDIGTLDPIPSNFDVMPFVPQLEVLAHASAMLCHAGMGSTMESLHFGVPLVHVPFTPEQDATAARVAELELGVSLDPADVTAAALRSAVDRAANDPLIAANVAAMQREIRACGGAPLAATLIERALSGID